ncbi:hypothetical protein CR194_16030 [Salipaludibacillus keqinensis]|uniref:Tryptophan-rich sensory protein n=1 Tax=Salipaludibacillus keqinensis TaxID=2045207 RepID=A0A323TAC9_9BACI|nr:TspO/MBR family protein [Salipaludibacillus keqinensis]PYZ92341.1 hypothetical protein CR194_16030 [Salipaludibacillus keqinensis]
MPLKNKHPYLWINALALIVVITVNALSNILPFNNLSTGEISDQLNVLFTPAGYVFSIWSVIYLFLVVWAIRPFIVSHKQDLLAYEKIGPAFVVNAVLNSMWLVLFHYEFFILTLFVMVSLLINLIVIYKRIRSVNETSIWMKLPFSIYLGWISVATIVNVGIFFNTLGFEEGLWLSAEGWTMTLLGIAVLLGIWFTSYNRDAVYPLVFVWAFIGIGVERSHEFPVLSTSAYIAAGVLAIYVLSQIYLLKGFYKNNG